MDQQVYDDYLEKSKFATNTFNRINFQFLYALLIFGLIYFLKSVSSPNLNDSQ